MKSFMGYPILSSGLSRRPRLGGHSARLIGMPGTRPGMTETLFRSAASRHHLRRAGERTAEGSVEVHAARLPRIGLAAIVHSPGDDPAERLLVDHDMAGDRALRAFGLRQLDGVVGLDRVLRLHAPAARG